MTSCVHPTYGTPTATAIGQEMWKQWLKGELGGDGGDDKDDGSNKDDGDNNGDGIVDDGDGSAPSIPPFTPLIVISAAVTAWSLL